MYEVNRIINRLTTTPQRSRMMSRIRGKDTLPELALRSALFASGFRYRLHQRHLPGSPDIVSPEYRVALFVHGCFWHRHEGCKYSTSPKMNSDFWRLKFEGNVSRDARNLTLLRDQGWRVAIIWECALKHSEDKVTQRIGAWLLGTEAVLTIG